MVGTRENGRIVGEQENTSNSFPLHLLLPLSIHPTLYPSTSSTSTTPSSTCRKCSSRFTACSVSPWHWIGFDPIPFLLNYTCYVPRAFRVDGRNRTPAWIHHNRRHTDAWDLHTIIHYNTILSTFPFRKKPTRMCLSARQTPPQ